MSFCAKCGAEMSPDAQFCPRCGTPAATHAAASTPQPPEIPPPTLPPPAAPVRTRVEPPNAAATPSAPVPPSPAHNATYVPPADVPKRSTWWIVPLVIVGLVVIAWLLLAGLPFGRKETRTTVAPATDTIAEGTSTARNEPITGTVIEVPGDEPATTETTAPPLQTQTTATLPPASVPPSSATTPPPATAHTPPRVVEESPRPVPAARPQPVQTPTQPRPVTTPPPAPRPAAQQPRPEPAPVVTQPQPSSPAGEISDAEAAATLRSYVTSNNYYDGVRGDCIQVRSQGYRNVGYTFTVWDACLSGGGSRMLGRWRVDSKTREVFRQRDDGRFLRP